uniref:Signal peptidase complex catalytic subunit SEC11 n=1 Tax=Hemiselmis tepida TaxID=464990 RepID=A0A7S0YZE4_9CRYP|mmetsp:Transcript_38409/g.98219  ORF Transcript_38409/g.98219 Transcript_38409/m.98219 type:complete len:180 (+) Transcript_38409:87-626(+)
MNVVTDTIQSLRSMRTRQLAHQVINLGLIVTSALMIWKSLMVVTNSESPVVVVLSGSMEPAFQRGDILFLWLGHGSFRVGEIVVFKIEGRDIPIVHRVIKLHEKRDGRVDVLTKGDNNDVDDRGLYAPDQRWLNRKHIIGRAMGYLPYVGMVTIIMNDYPYLKYALIGLLGIFVLTSRE